MMEFKWKNPQEKQLVVNDKKGVVYLSYPQIEETDMVVHGFTTRLGGVSQGIYSSMNLSFTRGDDEDCIYENYKRAADAIGFSYDSVVCSDQTHTTNVRLITESDRGNGLTKPKEFFDVDGMITDIPGLTLATFYADCVPLYFVDTRHKAIGLSHSGWRGTVGKMGRKTVEAMSEAFGTDPQEVIAAIGPSICVDCYEVSLDVADEFDRAFDDCTKILYPKENGKYQLDLWEANRQVLLEAGVSSEHITMPNLCTCCNKELLFSHRGLKGKRGNLAAFLAIK